MDQSSQPTTTEPACFKRVGQCLFRYVRNGNYYALVKKGGKQIRRSLKTTDRQLAERRLAELRAKIGKTRETTKDKGITFRELSDEWFQIAKTRLKPSSARGMHFCIRQLNKLFGILPVRHITPTDCQNWERQRVGISSSTFPVPLRPRPNPYKRQSTTLLSTGEVIDLFGTVSNNPTLSPK